ncbi:MAG: hypothetical protein K0Q53_2881 [Massilibacillus sp.]|jgi:hypothetical protein|nr:hypothetical protein [Massilibacillus sp.]
MRMLERILYGTKRTDSDSSGTWSYINRPVTDLLGYQVRPISTDLIGVLDASNSIITLFNL